MIGPSLDALAVRNTRTGQAETLSIIFSVTAGKRIIATVASITLFVGACGSETEDETDSTQAARSTSTTSTEATATTTATLSEQDKAEAEVEQLVIDWWTSPIDSSLGEDEPRHAYVTGLLRKRSIDNGNELAIEGQSLFGEGDGRIQVTEVLIDLDAGRGELNACTGDDSSIVDAATGEPVSEIGDPSFTFTSEFLVELTDDGWRIHEWYPSYNTGNPIECTIESE